ncbi:MAG: aromatic amino acid transport family protein [Candidatus Pacebacteria bacterium]|nr:aromatic amino acid transport family protein [Candidatus Paceibacterota bacterium]
MVLAKSLAVFLGTVIGVGIFSLPFVALKAGFFITAVYLISMAGVVVWVHFLYAEVVLKTEKIHRLTGYTEEYLGAGWKRSVFVIGLIGLGGSLIAYLIVGGDFLFSLLYPIFGGSPVLYTLIFFLFGSYLVYRDIKSISKIELLLVFILIFILSLFFITSYSFINTDYFKKIDSAFFTFPYGVVLFSLWGASIIPEIKEMLKREMGKNLLSKNLKKIIALGIVFSAFLYLFFIFITLGVSGPSTSKEAISGLVDKLGVNILGLGFIFGLLCCFTSFLTIALTLKKMLNYDFGINKGLSWLFTCFIPFILFLLGLREYIKIIGFLGAVSLGIEGIVIVFLYRAFLMKRSFKMNPINYFLVFIFILGIIFEAVYFLKP